MQLAFGSAVILLLLSGLAAYDAVVRFRAAQKWVNHTRDVQSALGDLNSVSARAGRARTRYVDTGDDTFLQEYQAAAADISSKLTQLKQFTADNPEQQDNWAHLQDITNRRLSLLDNSVQLKRGGAHVAEEQAGLREHTVVVSEEADLLFEIRQTEVRQVL